MDNRVNKFVMLFAWLFAICRDQYQGTNKNHKVFVNRITLPRQFISIRNLKTWPKYNSDGLINWLRRAWIGYEFHDASQSKIEVDPRLPFATRTTSRSAPKVHASKFISTYQILLHPNCSCCRDKVNRVASRRSRCHGFCTPPWQFYRDMTNPAHLSGPRHLDNFIMTPNARPLIGTLQKRMPTLTQTATH
jgi:hypothetical protein